MNILITRDPDRPGWRILENTGAGWWDWGIPQPDVQHALDSVLEFRSWRHPLQLTIE